MKQVVQNYGTGDLTVADVPMPSLRDGRVLVQTVNSAVSVGTEKLTTDLARKSLLGKALARPDMVRRVLNKARTDGILEAFQQATNRLDSSLGLGYSCAGQVIAVGTGVTDFRVGDRVACGGQGYASHAEVVCVPTNLCAHIPETLDYESASFVALGAIALHGVRTAQTTLGETVAVIGLGLLGQLTVQILKASGCRVFGIDRLPDRVALAKDLGADAGAVTGQDNVRAQVAQFTRGIGVDAALILASTPSNDPLMLAGDIARARGRIVAVGMVRLDVPRNLFYEKELGVIVSRSSGPGIYDMQYEQKGVDYPLPYVRWTLQRNMEEFLSLMAQGKVRLDRIITHRFPIADAAAAYDLLSGKKKEPFFGIVLKYATPDHATYQPTPIRLKPSSHNALRNSHDPVSIGLVGGGLFAKTTLLPELKQVSGIHLCGVATATGISARQIGDKFGFDYCTGDFRQLLSDPQINAVIIATRHNLHAPMIVEALQAGKHVFAEKPLALNAEQLHQISEAIRAHSDLQLMVGFNRRYSAYARQAKQWLMQQGGPYVVTCRVNAGAVPRDHWVNDPAEGGGRVIGEVCHFVDLIEYLAGARPTRAFAESLPANAEDVAITLRMDNGSVASILYTAQGDRALPRERVEIFAHQTACVLDNFKRLSLVREGKTITRQSFNMDKGHRAELETWVNGIRRGETQMDLKDDIYTTLTTFSIEESLRTGLPVEIDADAYLAA